MGNRHSAPENFKMLKKNYIQGIENKENFNIEQIFITLLMKLSYYQARCKLCKVPLIFEATAYSNPVNLTYFELPMTFDFISGMKIINKGEHSSTVKIIWNSKYEGFKEVIEEFTIGPDKTEEFNLRHLYLIFATQGKWVIKTDSDNIFIKYKCGVIDRRVLNKYQDKPIYFVNSIGKKFEYVSGSLIQFS